MNNSKASSIIFVTAVFFMLPAYFLGFAGHDAHIHGLWTKHFSQLLGEGLLYPRFANELTLGFGSYVFFFYPPVSLYINSLFAFLGSDKNFYYSALCASATLGLFTSGIAAYYWLRLKGSPKSALLVAILYMILPAHLLHDFYVTATMAQFWCYAWFPLILLYIERRNLPMTAIFMALLLMTNIPAAIVFLPFAVLYGLIIHPPKTYLSLATACVLALGLSAIYLLPVITYQNLVNVDLHWSLGVGFQYYNYFLDDILSIQPEESHRMVTFTCFIFTVLIYFYLLKGLTGKPLKIGLIFILLPSFFCFSISQPLWDYLPVLNKIQFPRRFLIIPTVFIALVAMQSIKLNSFSIKFISMVIILLLIQTGIIAYKRHISYEAEVVKELRVQYDNNIESYPVYIPGENINKFYPPSSELVNAPKAVVTNGIVEVVKWESRDIELKVTAKAGEEISLRQFYWPFWEAFIEGKEVKISEDKDLNIITLNLPNDLIKQTLSVKLATSPMEKLGWIISLLTLILTIGLILKNAKIQNNR